MTNENRLTNERIETSVEQLQLIQKELQQKNQMLAIAYHALEEERNQLQVVQLKICEQRAACANTVAEATDSADQDLSEALLCQAQRIEDLSFLANIMAYDLNNALISILTTIQGLSQEHINLEPRFQEILTVIEANAKRGANLVQQILASTQRSA